MTTRKADGVVWISGSSKGIVVGGKSGELGDLSRRGVGDLGIDELKAIDSQIDDDIQSAAQRLREMVEEERSTRAEAVEAEDDEVGALSYMDEWDLDENIF